jgi:hypothetical protein
MPLRSYHDGGDASIDRSSSRNRTSDEEIIVLLNATNTNPMPYLECNIMKQLHQQELLLLACWGWRGVVRSVGEEHELFVENVNSWPMRDQIMSYKNDYFVVYNTDWM